MALPSCPILERNPSVRKYRESELAKAWKTKRQLQAAFDLLVWVFAVPIAVGLRFDFSASVDSLGVASGLGVAAGFLFLGIGVFLKLHQGRYIVGSFDEVFGVFIVTCLTGLTLAAASFLLPDGLIPRSTAVIASGIALVLILGGRFGWRARQQELARSSNGTRTLIYGAGDAGQQIALLMLVDRANELIPVGFLDDDPNKSHLRRAGVRVLGNIQDLEQVAENYSIDVLLVAFTGVTAPLLLDLDRRCQLLNIKVRVIPTAAEIAGGAVRLGDISDVSVEDLLGRRQVASRVRDLSSFFNNRRILVTGAGGSIGSELVRQLANYAPDILVLLDRDESSLHAVQLTLDGSGTLTSSKLQLADIRDFERIQEVFHHFKPNIVFHAAALKHLPLLERFPGEAYKTNVLGTSNVLKAAESVAVDVFVNISTDKAADPSSVLGHSKLTTERLTSGMPDQLEAKYVSVRFGNVLGSRGSVIDTFRYQIEKGGPVTVTDESVTRYFMTVSEAVHLVLQAAVIGSHGETLVLDMGDPMRIVDVARYMIARSGREIDIVYTGLRDGEKLDEVLIARNESAAVRVHPKISHTRVNPLSFSEIRGNVSSQDAYYELARLSSLDER